MFSIFIHLQQSTLQSWQDVITQNTAEMGAVWSQGESPCCHNASHSSTFLLGFKTFSPKFT